MDFVVDYTKWAPKWTSRFCCPVVTRKPLKTRKFWKVNYQLRHAYKKRLEEAIVTEEKNNQGRLDEIHLPSHLLDEIHLPNHLLQNNSSYSLKDKSFYEDLLQRGQFSHMGAFYVVEMEKKEMEKKELEKEGAKIFVLATSNTWFTRPECIHCPLENCNENVTSPKELVEHLEWHVTDLGEASVFIHVCMDCLLFVSVKNQFLLRTIYSKKQQQQRSGKDILNEYNMATKKKKLIEHVRSTHFFLANAQERYLSATLTDDGYLELNLQERILFVMHTIPVYITNHLLMGPAALCDVFLKENV